MIKDVVRKICRSLAFKAMLTLYWIALTLLQKPCQIGLLFTHENGDFDFLRKARFRTFVAYIRDFKIRGREGNDNVS